MTNHANAQAFGAIATNYASLRPGPPAAALDWLVPKDCHTALELASGTGLATRELVKAVGSVIGVEPDARMREVFQQSGLAVEVRPGTAEAIPVHGRVFDGVYVFDAWHWFDPERALTEIARVLRPEGTLGVAWSQLDTTVDWVAEFWSSIEGAHPADRRPGQFALSAGAPFSVPQRHLVPWRRPVSSLDLIRLLGTYSVVLAMEPTVQADYLARQSHYLAEHAPLRAGGLIDVPYVTTCWRTRRIAT